MIVCSKINKKNRYLLKYWDSSPIDWQQKNRDILNKTIRVYNDYVLNKASYNEARDAIIYAQSRLQCECSEYMEDIFLMRSNILNIKSELR